MIPNNTVTLFGAATDDGVPACNTLSLSWTVVSGPGSVIFANPHAATTTAVLQTPGQYVLRLTVSDGQYAVSDDVVANFLATPNDPPVVNAGADQTIALPAAANLNGSVSDDGRPAGSVVTTTWSKVRVGWGA